MFVISSSIVFFSFSSAVSSLFFHEVSLEVRLVSSDSKDESLSFLEVSSLVSFDFSSS